VSKNILKTLLRQKIKPNLSVIRKLPVYLKNTTLMSHVEQLLSIERLWEYYLREKGNNPIEFSTN
jgi:hypothetical protein